MSMNMGGDPEEVAAKIFRFREIYGLTRSITHMGMGSMSQSELLVGVEHLGTEAAPNVHRDIGDA